MKTSEDNTNSDFFAYFLCFLWDIYKVAKQPFFLIP